MVTIQDTELKEGIQEAIERAKALSKPILVSEVQKINHIEPLSFYAAGKSRFFGERFFWKDPSGETYIIGLGVCKQIQSDQNAGRFERVEKEWKRFIGDSIVFNPYEENGTGPVMFGGFSFDPLKPKTKLWSKYSDSLFHVPTYMYSEVNGQAYLTTNVVCTQHDDQTLFEKVGAERGLILSSMEGDLPESDNALLKEADINPEKWMSIVEAIVDELKAGSLKKVVLARESRLVFEKPIEIESVLSNLMKLQRESFTFAFESNGDCFIGASPERLIKKYGENVFTTCLAGSIPRGRNEKDDNILGEALLSDQKNLTEHQYVVDMIKDAMEESCTEVELPKEPQIMKMRDIQHLYTPVIGKTRGDASLLALVDRLHPTPALGGLPKKEAVEKIREAEELDRGFYAAPLGWMDFRGNGEYAVAIRSGLIQGNEASIFAGCGVVQDSNAESEYQETKIKFRPMLTALGGYER
ncbi:isochorismate synthase [Cytobacillus sp. NCCP-133]|uniref:isochorismate synthase n=1 Tax=Cytobacillus sp. NCCP-133 TaxID=766848 RepID=UPI00222E971A|nr:isochorismate synthase [Cytobacillus sp. NCCP-133]GLB58618.1 isochorismate synthase MenF [Cytobacillus sp. NCCP-133]